MKVIRFLMLMVLINLCAGWGAGYAGVIPEVSPATATELVDHPSSIKQMLMAQYRKWVKTPYRSGGMSRNGIDCSGLVRMIFSQQFGIELPRTVRHQAQMGRNISSNHMEPGNLIFFKTGVRARHVGIYVGNHQFLHASVQKGVILSSLKNPYWAPRLWKIVKLK